MASPGIPLDGANLLHEMDSAARLTHVVAHLPMRFWRQSCRACRLRLSDHADQCVRYQL